MEVVEIIVSVALAGGFIYFIYTRIMAARDKKRGGGGGGARPGGPSPRVK